MPKYINKNNVIEALISVPQTYDEDNPFSYDHGWQLKLLIGFQQDGFPNWIIIDYNSEEECKEAIKKLELTEI